MTLAELLFDQARRRPDAVFVVHDEGEITYAEMAALASGMADALAARGIGAGDHVALLCPNRPRFLAAWLGAATLGAVTIPLGTWLVGEGLEFVLRQSDAKLLLADAGLLAEKRQNSPEALAAIEILELPEGEAAGPAPARLRRPVEQPEGAPTAILYTSGTTGRPKGAVIPHGSYLAAGRQMVEALGIGASERIMVVLPLFHANPQMYAVASALIAGCTLILRPKFSASAFFPDARRFGATAFTFVGTLLSILAKRVEGEVRDHGIRWGTGGGAPLEVWRDGQTHRFTLSPRSTDEPQADGGYANNWRIGVVGGMAFEPAKESVGPLRALAGGAELTMRIVSLSLSGLWHMVTGAISTCNISGPIGIAKTSGETASQGAESFIWFIAALSTAVGLLNLFPIPVLDGGHLLFHAFEAVAGRPPSDKAMRVFMTVGLTLILSLMLFALTNDLFCP